MSGSQHSTLVDDARERHFGQEPSHRDVPPGWCPICGLFEQLEAVQHENALIKNGSELCLKIERRDTIIQELQEQLEALRQALEDIATDSQIPHAAPAHLGWLARRALAGSNPAKRPT